MATLQSALRSAGLSVSSPEATQVASDLTQDYPKIETRQPVAVLKRELLWDSGTIEMKIPANVCVMTIGTDNGPVTYLQFAHFIKGGAVNLHVHTDNPQQFAGQKIIARAKVFRKDCKDGRSFIYVDLHPFNREIIKPTHRLTTMNVTPGVTSWAPTATVFLTPAPLQGAVVIVGHDQKFV